MRMTTSVAGASMAFAKKLYDRGTDCFGSDEIKQVFGIELDLANVPPIPFSEEELLRAHALGQSPFLFVDKTKNGKPLTMMAMRDQFKNKLGDGKLLFNTDWYEKKNKEAFFLSETPTFGWKLVSREVIPDSLGKDYLGQTQILADYVRDRVYKGVEMPPLYQKAIDELAERKEELAKIVRKDWKQGAEALVDLKINQLFRETPVEVLYRLVVYYKVNKERLLPATYAWTKKNPAIGCIVYVGRCGSRGVYVDDGGPDGSNSNLGVCFSRSSVPLES